MNKHQIQVIYPGERRFMYVHEYEGTTNYILERVFAGWNAGSNEEHPLFLQDKRARSMSSNDIVVVDGEYFQCEPVGWKRVDENYVNELEKEVKNHPIYEQSAWCALDRVMFEKRYPNRAKNR
jgi:hypothetical protein